MGYENPRIQINQTNAEINKQVKNFNQDFNEEFDAINAQQAANIEANMEILETQQKKRALGDDLWYQQVEKYKPQGDYAKDTKSFLHNMHNRYYELLGCDTSECREELENLKNVPRQLSEVGGAWTGMNEQYKKAGGKKLFAPGSLNARTPNYIMQVMENGGTTKKVYNKETGHVEFEVFDSKGDRVMELDRKGGKTEKPLMVDAVDFTKGALSGNVSVNTYGDPAGLRREFQAGIAKDMDYKDYVQKVTDNTDQYDKKGYQDYTEANSLYKQNLQGANSGALMDDKKMMTDNYPVIINGLFEQAKGGDPAALASLEKLDQQTGGKILGGDGLGGTNDLDLSSGLAVQSAIGMWDNSDVQREAADAYFKHYDQDSNLLKPDRIDKTNVKSSPTNAERRAQANFNKTQIKDTAKLKAANNEKEFVTNFDSMFASAKTQDEVADILDNELGNFDMSNSNQGSGSLKDFINSGRLEISEQKEDGTFDISLNKIKKNTKGEVVSTTEVKAYNTGNANNMNTLRDDFGITNKTYKSQGEAPSEQEEQATPAAKQNNTLNAASFNKNNQPKPKVEAKSDFVPDPKINYESLPMMDKRRIEYDNYIKSQKTEETQNVPAATEVKPIVPAAAEVKPEVKPSSNVESTQEKVVVKNKPTSKKLDSKTRYGHLVAQEDFGGAANSQGKATSLKGVYNEDQAKEYETSTKQVTNYAKNKPAFYGAKGNKNKNPKKGLRTDVTPVVYDKLSDKSKMILQTEHFNMHWDPRVLLLQTSGMLGDYSRGQLHNDGDLLLKQWNSITSNPKELAKFNKAIAGKETQLLNNLEQIMKGTEGNQDQYKKRIAYLKKLM